MHKFLLYMFLITFWFGCGTACQRMSLADLEAYDAALTRGYTLQRNGAHNDVTIDVKSAKYPKGVYMYRCTQCAEVRNYGAALAGRRACPNSPEVPTQTNTSELILMRDRMAPAPDPRKRGTPEWWRANLPERWTPEWPARKSELMAELTAESTAATSADLVMLKRSIAKLQAEKEQAALALREEQQRSAQLAQKLAEKDNFLDLLSLAASSSAPSIDHYKCFLEFCGLSAGQYQSLSIDRRLSYLAKYHKFIVDKTLGDISESGSDVDDTQSSGASLPRISLPLSRFRTAVEIYNYKSASTWIMRLGIINATSLAYRLGTGDVLDQPDQDINADLPTSYWRAYKAGRFTTGVYSATDISVLQSSGSFVVAANFDANGCSDDYPKILIAFHGMRVNSAVVTKSIVKDDVTTASKLITRSLREKTSFRDLPIELTAHLGFLDAADSAFAEVGSCITSALAGKPLSDVQLIVTGHSMGGAIGSITSIGLLNALRRISGNPNFNGVNAKNNVVLLTMGQPRVWGKAPWDAATVQAILSSPLTGTLIGLGKSARELVAGNARKVDEIMGEENCLRIVTAYGSTKKSVFWKHDFVAQIPPALTLGYKHTKKEQRAFLTEDLKGAGKLAHDLSRYYRPCMLADGEAK